MGLVNVVARLYLDTNVFISSFEKNDEQSRLLLELLVLNAGDRQPFLTTSELSLAELLVDPYRKDNERLIRIYENLTLTNDFIEVGPVNRDVLRHAAALRANYSSLRLPDAIHLSTAMHFRCSHILTSDLRLKGSYPTRQSRLGVPGHAVSVEILRPDVPVLEKLLKEFSR